MANATKSSRDSWGTRVGVIMAVMGSAVGLGNFLRFPGLAAQYKGGAFMIPYFIALLLIGLPLAWAEWAMGRYGGRHGYNSTPGIYRALWKTRFAPYVGVLGVLVPVTIYMYYVLIESWCLGYAWYYLNGTMALLGRQAARNAPTAAHSVAGLDPSVYTGFFQRVTGSAFNGAAFSPRAWQGLLFLVICFVLNFVLIYRGLRRGIEKFCLLAMPALVACALLVLFRVLTLANITSGLAFMWNPQVKGTGLLQALANPDMWLAATSQIFFTLSVGFGVIITYASYLRRDDDIALSALTSASGNEFCEVALGGMIIIPTAFIFLGAAQVDKVAGSSFNLGFNTLPMVFEKMPLGYVVGFLFFFLLFIAAVTSSLSMLQPAIALLEEGLGLTRKASVSLLGFITLIGSGFVLYFSKGNIALGTFDFWVGSLLIFVLALMQTIMFGWVLGIKDGMKELDSGAEIRIPRIVGYLLKYVSPTYLLAIFILWIYQNVTTKKNNPFLAIAHNHVVQLTLGFITLVGLLFVLLIAQANKRWQRNPPTAIETLAEETAP